MVIKFVFLLTFLFFQLFINNEWHKSKSGKTFETINPATEKCIADIQCAGKEDVELAVKAARNAFKYVPYTQKNRNAC